MYGHGTMAKTVKQKPVYPTTVKMLKEEANDCGG